MITAFGFLVLVFLLWNIVTSINIVKILSANGIKADLRWLRFKAFGYAQKYKDLTLSKEGKIGSLYYHFTISMTLFIVTIIIGIILAYSIKQ